jgi:hypothetical protein
VEPRALNFAVTAIMTDARFAVRYGRQAETMPHISPTLMLMSGGWISMLAHEGARVLSEHAPDLLHGSPEDAAAVIARARHGLKLFEDKARSIDEYQALFRDIAEEHRRYFIDPVVKPLQFLAHDLGLTTVQKRLVLTTQGAAFAVGLPPDVINDPDLRERFGGLSYEWGAYVALAGLATEGPPLACLSEIADLRPDDFIDKKSSRFYPAAFNGPTTPYLNGVLLYFEALCNFIAWLMPRSTAADEAERFSVFKIRFVTTIHLLRSLDRLLKYDALTPRLRDQIRGVLAQVPLEYQRPEIGWLRNLLVHYLPARSFNFDLADALPLTDAAVVGVGFRESANDLAEQVDRTLIDLSVGFSTWRSLPLR